MMNTDRNIPILRAMRGITAFVKCKYTQKIFWLFSLSIPVVLLAALVAQGRQGGTELCMDIGSCKSMFCNKDTTSWPQKTESGLDPALAFPIIESDDRANQTKPISCQAGLKFKDGQPQFFDEKKRPLENVKFIPGVYACNTLNKPPVASQEMISALKKAGQIALSKGYYLHVTDAYRSIGTQIAMACALINTKKGGDLGGSVAWPGGSNHGDGFAVDIQLLNPKKKDILGTYVVVASGNCKNQHSVDIKDMLMLDEIMTEAGFVRYEAETWHYEIGGPTTSCRCKFPDCPKPTGPAFCKKCS